MNFINIYVLSLCFCVLIVKIIMNVCVVYQAIIEVQINASSASFQLGLVAREVRITRTFQHGRKLSGPRAIRWKRLTYTPPDYGHRRRCVTTFCSHR